MTQKQAIMLQGTGSDVGKTMLVAGICRFLYRQGIKVAPFKPQNMSNNAAVSEEGGEIGRGQWLQAIASGIAPSVHMNPVLLKPQGETGAQIIVQGQIYGQAKGIEYQKIKQTLLPKVMESYRILRQDYDWIVVEGAGSPAEVNLRAGDIANMGFARAADIPVLLVGDIDRGGVIASIVGTHFLLEKEDRKMIVGYLINKFRGDPDLFADGMTTITQWTGWPALGIVPWIEDFALLPSEDSLSLVQKTKLNYGGAQSTEAKIRIIVPILPYIANFDDFAPLEQEPDVELIYIRPGQKLPDADCILLAGSKATLADMQQLRDSGWEADILHHVAKGGSVIGLCGGLQMLGRKISDPDAVEGKMKEIKGLGLLDIETILQNGKIIRNVSGFFVSPSLVVSGYEIHAGQTIGPDCRHALVTIEGRSDGAASRNGKIWGTYLHGIFSQGDFRRHWLNGLGLQQRGGFSKGKCYDETIEDTLDTIADLLEKTINMKALFALAR